MTTEQKIKTSLLEFEKRLHGQHQQLLPGIPDDITLAVITPKLPWKALLVLPSVSCVWQHAVQSRQVYDARVRAKATEPLEVERFFWPLDGNLCVDESCFTRGGFQVSSKSDHSCSWVIPRIQAQKKEPVYYFDLSGILDGRIYVLGAHFDDYNEYYDPWTAAARLFVFDLAGNRAWKECARTNEPRLLMSEAEAGYLKDGKFFLDGFSLASNTFGTEVYDPDLNSWSPAACRTKANLDLKLERRKHFVAI